MEESALLRLENENVSLPVVTGTEGEKAIDVRKLRSQTGFITYDDGYANTGSCESRVTFIDGEKGVLRYRGYPIEQLAEGSNFLESAYLVIYGELPSAAQMAKFEERINRRAPVHVAMENHFKGFPSHSHPMAILSAMLNTLGCFYPEMASNERDRDVEHFDEAAAILLSKVRTLAAMSYRMKVGRPYNFPLPDAGYTQNFLHLMFSAPHNQYETTAEAADALDLFLLLHADHEQNCSTSTVRMVASSDANLFSSVSAGVCALWGPLHGGANQAVIQMLERIRASGDDGRRFVEQAKSGQAKLMGFGHRVYKNYDPRAKILGRAADRLLQKLGRADPLLDIARHLEQVALEDDYFISRKLYPNVDFYSGIILRAIGIPLEMFTVMFAIGRMPGWIAHWKEMADSPKGRIHRPRQVYTGEVERPYVPLERR